MGSVTQPVTVDSLTSGFEGFFAAAVPTVRHKASADNMTFFIASLLLQMQLC
jgi:hypothetical protein